MSITKFTIYSEDFLLLGANNIKVIAFLTSYSSVTSGDPIETEITIIDPCLDPFSLTKPGQTPPDNYFYTEDAPLLSFTTS